MPEVGEPLAGGSMNAPVRFDDRVHRVAGPWTPTVHALLRHVRDRGVVVLPEVLGMDDEGREVLTFLPGVVPAYPMPGFVWTDENLEASGRLLRAVHDATAGFELAGRTWQLPAHEPVEVVCLNDVAPYNMVFVDGRVTGLIDIDTASPGPRVWDLAYLAYRLVPIASPGNPDLPAPSAPELRRRLALLCAAYGDVDPEAVLAVVPERLLELAAFTEARAGERPELAAHARMYRTDAAWAASVRC
ncbi:phosphotransferase [Amnibacterium sp. CER49]|uniref:phosphotransferase n=1 Tax=Amnibacterium sp. CER49 TaxID=3039161 RepID=UPI0024492B2E|nr:phosphotransferase [Amnibacterium sp. CER49]MDH2444047.1 phosphotransferase [Amnibacterium sp. CER49]